MSARYGELFAGIGGMSLGLERAGWEPAWFAERDEFCSQVLAKHWPAVPNLGDVTTVDWEEVERVDLVCGGFPCQPFSLAGKQLGADDPRYLWPEVVRCLRVLRPRLVLLENVPGLVTSPEFGRVLGDLAALGYDTEWDCIPAAAVGAPHLRYRLFIVAYPECDELREQPIAFIRSDGATVVGDDGTTWSVADTDGGRRDWWSRSFGSGGRAEPADGGGVGNPDGEGQLQPQGPLGEEWRRVGDPGWWTVEPDVGRVAHGVPHRVDRLRALGNAVVPQVAEWIGRHLLEHVKAAA